MPRKRHQTDSFQSDVYPAAASSESSLSASEFFTGKTAPCKLTPVLSRSESAPVPRPASPISESPVVLTPPAQVDDEGKATASEAEVNRLNSELRAAREKIRNMELRVEGLKRV
ncbi:hypothetical protein BDR06DRAFT_977971 [Suillus hirtellus]|nr:hypothetical protein BDR06DRAFT_977971 [Suillus hirtellus]